MTRGTKVRMPYDDGWRGTTLYGTVVAAGPRTVTIEWESGLRNRVQRADLRAHGIVETRAGEWTP